MSMAIDVSHWTGEVTTQQMECLARRGVRRVIVCAQRREVARQQLATAVAAGLEVEGYVYLYLRADVTGRVHRALETLAGFPVRRLWLDAEGHDQRTGISRGGGAGPAGAGRVRRLRHRDLHRRLVVAAAHR